MGDIHGACRALRQCLERARFDRDHDQLICLGDVCDGWPETRACIDELLTIRSLTYLLGNHDFWALAWMKSGLKDEFWLQQGGRATVQSYENNVPESHHSFLDKAKPFFLLDNSLFVHAGIDPVKPLEFQDFNTLLWDRNLARMARESHQQGVDRQFSDFDNIYIGHTPVPEGPLHAGNVWLMDTGAGWSGVLTMMDIFSGEIFQSDPVPLLYPGVTGRTRK